MSNEETSEEIEITAAEGTEGEASEETKEPAWQAFASGLMAHAQALGLQVTEQKGFVKFVNGVTGHKLYAAKGGRAVKRVDTTLPILGQANTLPLEKANGKIECHVIPEVEAVKEVLTLLASDQFGALRPSKRAAKAEGQAAS